MSQKVSFIQELTSNHCINIKIINMKHKSVVRIAIAIFVFFSSLNTIFAQESVTIPSKKALMMELNFKPFGEEIISFNQLQFKYKATDQFVIRLGLAFDYDTWDLPGDDYDPSEEIKINGNEKSTKYGISPGIEYHFLKNSRISPYVGLELSFTNLSIESHYTDVRTEYNNDSYIFIPVKVDIEGATREVTRDYIQTSQGYYQYYTSTSYPKRAYTSFGGNLLAGCDFYFMRSMYVGAEVGLGYSRILYKKATIMISDNVNPTILPSYTNTTFGFYYNSALRLGFWF